MSRRPPAQISECARLIRASSSIAGTGLMSVSPPATTRVYCGASPYCLGKASRAPIWFLDAFAGWISSDVQDDALASLVDECKLHKRAVSQRPDSELVFKGLGVAKRYCRRDSIGDSFLQRRPRGGHPGAAPGRDAPPPATPPRMQSTTEVISKGHEEPRTLSPLARGLGGRVLERVDHAVRRRG